VGRSGAGSADRWSCPITHWGSIHCHEYDAPPDQLNRLVSKKASSKISQPCWAWAGNSMFRYMTLLTARPCSVTPHL
jgi:hypothetical protein